MSKVHCGGPTCPGDPYSTDACECDGSCARCIPSTFANDSDELEIVTSARDPVQELLKRFEPGSQARKELEETLELRKRAEIAFQRMLIGDGADVVREAHWLAANAEEVAYRWFVMRQLMLKNEMIATPSIIVLKKR